MRMNADPVRTAGEPRVLATVISAASLSRCAPIALLVGTLLSPVNQGSVIASDALGRRSYRAVSVQVTGSSWTP